MQQGGLDIALVTSLVLEELRKAGVSIRPDAPQIPINVSGRHLHLSRADLDKLFGSGFQLTVLRPISQPGQFASEQTVTLRTLKGEIKGLRVLGPVRPETQVELAMSEARRLGLNPPIRLSGALEGSCGCTLIGPYGSVTLERGVIVARRHIHMTPAQAAAMGAAPGACVKVLVDTPRGGVLHDVAVSVREDFALDMHLDTDEANAFLILPDCRATILMEA